VTTTANPQALATSDREMDLSQTLAHLGRMNLLAISGGRYRRTVGPETGRLLAVELPVSSGYAVRVTLAANDTYTVQRVMRRGAKTWVKGTQTDVYAEDLGETCYVASCYKNRDFG
jgi:hypothetical protein